MSGAARRELLIRFAGRGPEPRIDVGADHGRVAAALGAIATERAPGRRGKATVRWVVADGLAPFRAVGTAIVAGMGARTIARILQAAPPVQVAVLHAQDDPPALRRWLATHGWRIEDEALAPEGRGFAEVILARPGIELATGLHLDYGPVLLASQDPWLPQHLAHRLRELDSLTAPARGLPEAQQADYRARSAFLREVLHRRPADEPT